MNGLEFTANVVDAIAWPGAALLMVWWLRDRIGAAITTVASRLSRVQAAGVIGEFATPELAEASKTLVGQSPEIGEPAEQPEAQVGAETEEERRAAVEALMDAAAQWGFVQGQSGMWSAPPSPIVDWDTDGSAKILAGVVRSQPTPPQPARRRATPPLPPVRRGRFSSPPFPQPEQGDDRHEGDK